MSEWQEQRQHAGKHFGVSHALEQGHVFLAPAQHINAVACFQSYHCLEWMIQRSLSPVFQR